MATTKKNNRGKNGKGRVILIKTMTMNEHFWHHVTSSRSSWSVFPYLEFDRTKNWIEIFHPSWFIHSCVQQIFTGCFLDAKHCPRHWGYRGVPSLPGPCGLIVFRVHRPRKQTTETRTKGQAEWANLYVKKICFFSGHYLEPHHAVPTSYALGKLQNNVSKVGGLLEAGIEYIKDSQKLKLKEAEIKKKNRLRTYLYIICMTKNKQ